jgi:hypothetical protein
MLEVTRAQYQDGYRIWLEFNDGISGVVDLADALWGPVFEPLKDFEQFKRFTVSRVLHTLVWENDADLAPEHLYGKIAGKRHQTATSPSERAAIT